MLYIDLRPGQAVKIGNAPVKITGASGRGISGYYNLHRGQVEWVRNCDAHKKKVGVNYYITQCTGNSSSWGSDELGIRRVWRSDQLERRYWIEEHVPERLGPRLSSPGERERNAAMANRVGVNRLQFCSVFNSLSHTTLSIKWEVYFSKELYSSSLLCCRYAFAYEYTTSGYVHFQTFGKAMNHLILHNWIVSLLFFFGDCFRIK